MKGNLKELIHGNYDLEVRGNWDIETKGHHYDNSGVHTKLTSSRIDLNP